MKNKRIALFRPKFSETLTEPTPYPPFGLFYLRKVLMDNEFEVDVFDSCSDFGCETKILNNIEHYSILGITALTGSMIKYGLELAEKCKKIKPDIKIIFGGIHASIYPLQTVLHSLIDGVVYGSAETVFPVLCNHILEGREDDIYNLSQVLWKTCLNRENIRFVECNGPVFSLRDLYLVFDMMEPYIAADQKGNSRRMPFLTGRGCPHNCTFCMSGSSFCRWYTLKNEEIHDSIDCSLEYYKVNGINFRDEEFFISKKRIEDMADDIIKRKINIRFNGNSKLEYYKSYSDDFIMKLLDAGWSGTNIGIESGSDRIIKKTGKVFTAEEVIIANRRLKKIAPDFSVSYGFMVGFPFEEIEDTNKTFDVIYMLLNENPNASILGPHFYTPFPGSQLFEEFKKDFPFIEMQNLEEWQELKIITFYNPINIFHRNARYWDNLLKKYERLNDNLKNRMHVHKGFTKQDN